LPGAASALRLVKARCCAGSVSIPCRAINMSGPHSADDHISACRAGLGRTCRT